MGVRGNFVRGHARPTIVAKGNFHTPLPQSLQQNALTLRCNAVSNTFSKYATI